jgi:hypothetical protein
MWVAFSPECQVCVRISAGAFVGKLWSLGNLWKRWPQPAGKEKAPARCQRYAAKNSIGQLLAFSPYRNAYHPRSSAHNSVALWMVVRSRGHARQLLLHYVRKLFHLPLHLNHLLTHIQDDLDARQIHAHIPGQRQYHIQPL